MPFDPIEESGKQYLIYKKQEGQFLDTVTLGMLENNEIKMVLPFIFIQRDNEAELRFEVTEYKSVRDVFQGKTNRAKLLKFFRSIKSIIENCESYMVDGTQIVFDPDYIYINERNKEMGFVLLPLLNEQRDINAQLKEFFLSLNFDRSEDCSYVAEILDYFKNNNSFSLFHFSNMVESMGKNTGRRNTIPDRESVPLHNRTEKTDIPYNPPPQKTVQTAQEETPEEEEEPIEAKKKGFLFFWKKKKEKSSDKSGSPVGNRKKATAFGGIAIPGQEDGGYSKGSVQIPSGEQSIKAQKIDMNYHYTAEEDFGTTQLLRNDDEQQLKLIRKKTGESFGLTKEITKIGRKNSIVDICIRGNRHVGRLHAVVFKDDDGYSIEDNNSMNGTYINDMHSRISGKTRINAGDHLFLGNEELIVK